MPHNTRATLELLPLFSVYAFIWGAIWGSFLNVVIYRLPRGLSLVRPGSHCAACELPIPWYENIPLVSYWLLRGRCRRCGARFSARYVVVELLTAVLSLLLFVKCADGRLEEASIGQILVPFLFYFYFLCAAIAIAFIDIELTVIPDQLTVPGAALGVVAALLIPKDGAFVDLFPSVTWIDSVAGLVAGAGLVLLIIGGYKLLTGRVGMGGGDATMLAMIGAFLGWQSLVVVLFLASTQGVLAAVVAAGIQRFGGRRGEFLLRGVDRPEYWQNKEDGPGETEQSGGAASRDDGSSNEAPPELEKDPASEAVHRSDVHDALEDEAVSFGKVGLPFGPFLALAAVEYLFVGHWIQAWLMLEGYIVRFSLRAQIALILLGLTGLTVLLVSFPVLNLMERALLEREIGAGRRLAPVVQRVLETSALGRPAAAAERVEEALHRLFEGGVVEQAVLLGIGGEVLLAWPDPDDVPSVADVVPSDLEGAGDVRLVEAPGGERFVRLAVPLSGEVGGAAVLWLWTGAVAEQLETARFLTTLYALLAAGVVLIAGFVLLSRLVVAPIRRIRVATERVAAGDHASRLDITSGNEIGDLASSFNHMLDRLEEGRRALQRQVTALEAASRDLERAQRAVIRGEKLASVGRLAAGVAHEVGNPLAAVLGIVELMREDPDLVVEERVDLLARLERELLRIHETIRDLLDYSRSSSEEIAEISVTEVVEQARKLVEAQPRFRRIRLDLQPQEKLPLVWADADRLLQVTVNLLLNAADAIDGEGQVTVTVERREKGVAIAVTDSGPGIARDVLDHIFEPFYTTKPPGQGTGLGLAICESIVEGLGGDLSVEGGSAGIGATFTIWLPAVGEEV